MVFVQENASFDRASNPHLLSEFRPLGHQRVVRFVCWFQLLDTFALQHRLGGQEDYIFERDRKWRMHWRGPHDTQLKIAENEVALSMKKHLHECNSALEPHSNIETPPTSMMTTGCADKSDHHIEVAKSKVETYASLENHALLPHGFTSHIARTTHPPTHPRI